MVKKLLVDVDCGVDDAQAIMLALAAPNVKLLGVTCVHGNTTVENVCKNTLRVLQACNRLEVQQQYYFLSGLVVNLSLFRPTSLCLFKSVPSLNLEYFLHHVKSQDALYETAQQ